jgi:hypothetical protein
MKNQLKHLALIAGLATIPALTSLAQPYYVTGSAMVPAWSPGTPAYEMTGGPAVYSLTTATAADAYHELKITGATWSDPNYPGNNLKLKGDANGTNTLYFYPGTPGDGWLPIANRVGYADPGNMAWEIAGDFNSWSGGAGYDLPSIGSGVYSNGIVIATAGTYQFKIRSLGAWDVAFGSPDLGHNNANASITTTNSPQTVPIVLDLPNGRFLIGTLVPPPVTNDVVFLVDMSVEILRGAFNPATDAVFVSGAFNNWPGTGTNALALTNIPTWGGNTNIYYATNTFIGTPSTIGSEYKFTDNNPALSGSGGYEPLPQNRTFTLLSSNGILVLPVVNFGDSLASDYTTAGVLVTFSVNMAGRASVSNVVFDPSIHPAPYINGNFITSGWAAWSPIGLAPYQMTEDPIGSTNYTFTYNVPAGGFVLVQYKYAFDDGVNSLDNEAPPGQDHVRYIRTTATGSYTMPNDLFGNQYNEPSFGELAVGAASGGTVPVKWLGRPGVKLQGTASLTGAWTELVETDGTNWSAGSSTTNGLLSTTNWPASSGNQFFRLIKQ